MGAPSSSGPKPPHFIFVNCKIRCHFEALPKLAAKRISSPLHTQTVGISKEEGLCHSLSVHICTATSQTVNMPISCGLKPVTHLAILYKLARCIASLRVTAYPHLHLFQAVRQGQCSGVSRTNSSFLPCYLFNVTTANSRQKQTASSLGAY